MIILGIDPGFLAGGFAVLKKSNQQAYLLDHGYLAMTSSQPISVRIALFYDFFLEKIVKWTVTDIALETPFLGKNVQNFLKLGYLRGILYLLAEKYSIELHEFSPREVKQSLTGFGGASKEQVARVVMQLFPQIEKPKKEDITDALAITLCGLWKKNIKISLKKGIF